MYTLVRRYIKTAIVFLALGLIIGGWMMARRELYDLYPSSYVVSAHTHAIFVGFVMMMILGVALWLFPRPDKEDTRYRPALVEGAYWLLTVGTAGRVAGELLRTTIGATWLRAAILACGASQIVAFLLFFHAMWSRIRPLGSRAREARGERF
ncbi:MAG TPA: cbb3-type cytochrome c oxidase subunit I [Gemmatimonadaceae bacterium]